MTATEGKAIFDYIRKALNIKLSEKEIRKSKILLKFIANAQPGDKQTVKKWIDSCFEALK